MRVTYSKSHEENVIKLAMLTSHYYETITLLLGITMLLPWYYPIITCLFQIMPFYYINCTSARHLTMVLLWNKFYWDYFLLSKVQTCLYKVCLFFLLLILFHMLFYSENCVRCHLNITSFFKSFFNFSLYVTIPPSAPIHYTICYTVPIFSVFKQFWYVAGCVVVL